ncbi:MAG: NifB/NifX family molybdenum-iron cluster-binding protein [Desulfobacterales bacterium]|jgi:predicted Fe-Mo cluster-binding NifX family protein|nr:NifB/NifX family molybdenum-iron cluster-binding protein [Desulfobacterales bacterium]
MKLAVSAAGKTLSSQVDPRFGRCPYFLIVETDSMAIAAYPNENAGLQGGAGIQAAAFVAEKGAKAVLTGRCGPNAVLALAAAGIDLYEAVGGIPAREAIDKFLSKELTPSGGNAAELFDVKSSPFGMHQEFGRRPGSRGGNASRSRSGQRPRS